MAWAKAHIEIKPASVGTGIKVSLKKVRSGSAKMSVSITGQTIKELGWADGDGIEVLLGEGEHHGLMRLRKNASTAQVHVKERSAVRGGSFLQLSLGHQPAFVDRSEAAAWCQWEKVDEGWIEVVLPKWADETAPSRKQAVAAPSASRPVAPAQAARNVTASIMGDPPPGRREMLQKMGEIGSK